MKAAKIKSAPQFDSYAWRQLGIITYGEDNNFPQVVDELVRASKTATACLAIKNSFVNGMGLAEPNTGDILVNGQGLRLSKFRRLILRDINKFNGVAIHINYNRQYKVRAVSVLPFEQLRLGLPNDAGVITRIAHHPDWAGRDKWRGTRIQSFNKELTWYDVYNPEPDIIESQVTAAGGWNEWKGQVMYVSGADEADLCYPVPTYIAALTDMRTEEGLMNVAARNVCSNFMTAGVLVDIMEAEQNETQIHNKQRELDKFQGDEMALQLWYMQAKNKDEVPVFVPFAGANYDKAFSQTQSIIPDAIGQSFNQPPILRAKDVGANFGADLMTNCYKYYNSVTVSERQQLEEVLETVFSNWWVDLEGASFRTECLVYNAGASVADRLGKDAMIQVLDVVRDTTLTLIQKRNLLKYAYGLYADEIIHLLPNTDTNDTNPNSSAQGAANRGEHQRFGKIRALFNRIRKSSIN